MPFGLKQILVFALLLAAFTSKVLAYQLNQPFPDFTLPAADLDYGQKLSEQRGFPVMILVLDRCNGCEKKLLNFQMLAAQYANQHLVTWVVWHSYKKHQPPSLHLPVLNANTHLASGWQSPARKPVAYFIDRDGVLVHQIDGSLKSITKKTQEYLPSWLQESQAEHQGRVQQ